MHPRKLLRRPSPATAIASVALFVSLGGASYAAVSIPSSSVGTTQLKNGAVSNAKLEKGAVDGSKIKGSSINYSKIAKNTIGKARINPDQVQERVSGVCTNGAVTSISATGTVTCKNASGADLMVSTPTPSGIGASAANILTETLPAGSSYLLTANPQITFGALSSGTEAIEVDCSLSVGGLASQTQSRSIQVALGTRTQTESVPFQVQVASSAATQTAGLVCIAKHNDGTVQPTVTASASINALQTSGNTALPYSG